MNKVEEFLKNEKNHYGKIYVDLTYSIDNVSPFLDSKNLSTRKYISKISVLKRYIELIEAAESELHKKSAFSRFLNEDKYINLLNSYKEDKSELLTQLENCSHCAYLNCTENAFDGCLSCKSGSRIVHCDHKKINVSTHDNWTLDLTNDKTGISDRYKVLATLQDIEKEQKYIIIVNLITDEKFILYYYPGISEDSYGEIADSEEFNFIVSTYQSLEE